MVQKWVTPKGTIRSGFPNQGGNVGRTGTADNRKMGTAIGSSLGEKKGEVRSNSLFEIRKRPAELASSLLRADSRRSALGVGNRGAFDK